MPARRADTHVHEFIQSCDTRRGTTVMTADDFRRLALGMPGVIERAHMGHPDFRVNGRIFATLRADERWGMVKLLPDEQQEIIRLTPDVFVPSSGAWGRQGCTDVRLEAATEATVRGAMLLAWQGASAKPPSSRPPATRSGGRGSSIRRRR